MSWLFKHKLLVLCIIAGGIYLWVNPSGKFGMHRKGFVVYNRIPILLFDCYINISGKLYLEEDLSRNLSINYWKENHLESSRRTTQALIPLLVGTGFGDSAQVSFKQNVMAHCRELRFEPHFYSSQEAIARYNRFREENKSVAILLKVK